MIPRTNPFHSVRHERLRAWFGSVRLSDQVWRRAGGLRWLGTRGNCVAISDVLFRRGGPRCPAAPMIEWDEGGGAEKQHREGQYSGMRGQMLRNVARVSYPAFPIHPTY